MEGPKGKRRGETAVLVLVAAPVLGLLLGGVYSLPALWLTKEREPWLSALLSGGLAVSVFGVGSLLRTPLLASAWTWALTLVLLQVGRVVYGGLGHSLERYGVVHAAALVLTAVASVVSSGGPG